MYCKKCGKNLNQDEKSCSNCGFEKDIQDKQAEANSNNTVGKNTKKKKKWLLIILAIPVLYILIVGTMGIADLISEFSNYMGVDKNDDIDKMINYMNEKYVDDEFTYVSVYGGHLGDNQTKIIVSSKKYPNSEIRVICTDSYECTDNYLGIKYEEKTRSYLKDKLTKSFGNKVYVDYVADDRACTRNGSSNTTFEEYVANEHSGIYFTAIIGYDVNDNTEDIILNKIKDTFSDTTISADIFFVDENIEYSNYDTYDEFVSYIQNKQYNKRLFLIKENVKNYSAIEWTNN